jgi:hypothetical protein
MRCDDARPLIGADLDGEATPTESAAAAEHLTGCADCRAWRDEVVRLDAVFAIPPDVTPLDPAAVAALSAAGGGVAAGLGSSAPTAAAAAAVPAARAGRSRGPIIAASLLAAALITGTAVGLLSGDGDDPTPITLPGVGVSQSESEVAGPSVSSSASASASPTASASVSPTASPSPSPSATVSPTPSPSRSPSSSPSATLAPQPLVATARAGVLDLTLRVADSHPVGAISIELRIMNNTDRPVTYRSPSCRELAVRLDGAIVYPKQTPGCTEQYEEHTLQPGQAHARALEYATQPGEHRVEGVFEGADVQPSPGPDGGKPTPGPKRVSDATAGPIVVRVR